MQANASWHTVRMNLYWGMIGWGELIQNGLNLFFSPVCWLLVSAKVMPHPHGGKAAPLAEEFFAILSWNLSGKSKCYSLQWLDASRVYQSLLTRRADCLIKDQNLYEGFLWVPPTLPTIPFGLIPATCHLYHVGFELLSPLIDIVLVPLSSSEIRVSWKY